MRLLTLNFLKRMSFDKFDFDEQKETTKHLPEVIDREGTLFSYGTLLNRKDVLEPFLRTTRGNNFCVAETQSLSDAQQIRAQNPTSVVILTDVKLEGITRSIITENQLRNLFAERVSQDDLQQILKTLDETQRAELFERIGVAGKDQLLAFLFDESIEEQKRWENIKNFHMAYLRTLGVTEEDVPEIPKQNAYLCAEPYGDRFLNGGLIIGLSEEEVKKLQAYEYWPIYQLTPTPQLTIENTAYTPASIQFFATIIRNLHSDKTRKHVQSVLSIGSEKGTRPQAKWPRNVGSLSLHDEHRNTEKTA